MLSDSQSAAFRRSLAERANAASSVRPRCAFNYREYV